MPHDQRLSARTKETGPVNASAHRTCIKRLEMRFFELLQSIIDISEVMGKTMYTYVTDFSIHNYYKPSNASIFLYSYVFFSVRILVML